MSQFTGKVVLVTGGTSGIGKAAAIAFAKAGAKVVLSGRREKEGLAAVEEIRKLHGDAHFVRADVSQEADVKNLVEKTLAKYGRLDIAFNNAGVEWAGSLAEATEADYRQVFDINVWGVLASMRYEIPAMLRTGGGAIINTSSIAGHVAGPNAGVYIASKHAVEGLTKAAALEHARQGIRVNAVAPAAIQTDMLDRFAGSDEVKSAFAGMHPVGRIGRSEEVAAAVLYLASDEAKFTTGISLPVDGGWLAQ
ncbi:MAG TPA: SDR family oxidoreductase [Gemmataceae bacterium]|nr:SDR family oxidoreductase [Gemmataceae bacterium]